MERRFIKDHCVAGSTKRRVRCLEATRNEEAFEESLHLTGRTARNDEFPEGLMRSLEGKLSAVRNERRHPGIGWYVLFFRPPPFRNVAADDAELLFCFERSSLLVSPLGVHTTSAIVTRVLHSSSYQDSFPPSLSLSLSLRLFTEGTSSLYTLCTLHPFPY